MIVEAFKETLDKGLKEYGQVVVSISLRSIRKSSIVVSHCVLSAYCDDMTAYDSYVCVRMAKR
jgi:hypothetical protein